MGVAGCIFKYATLRLAALNILQIRLLNRENKTMSQLNEQQIDPSARNLLLIAISVVVVCMLVPFGEYIIYPFRLFGTFVHESSHALATILSGGSVEGMHVNWDTSGQTLSRGGARFFVSSAGYLGSMVLGAGLLVAGSRRKWAKHTMIALGTATLLATVAFAGYGSALIAVLGFVAGLGLLALGRNPRRQDVPKSRMYYAGGAVILAFTVLYLALTNALLTWAVGLLVGGAILGVGLVGSRLVSHIAVLFLGVTLSLDGLDSLKQLYSLSTQGAGHSDAVNMASMTGVPAIVWAVIWGVSGLLMVGVALWLFWRADSHPSPQKAFRKK